MQQNKKKQDNKAVYKEIAPYLNLGLQLALTVGAFVLLGWWLDEKFSTSPILILICAFIGLAIGFYNFIKTAISNK